MIAGRRSTVDGEPNACRIAASLLAGSTGIQSTSGSQSVIAFGNFEMDHTAGVRSDRSIANFFAINRPAFATSIFVLVDFAETRPGADPAQFN